VTVDLSIVGVSQDTVGAGHDTLNHIEGVIGSAFDDHLYGGGTSEQDFLQTFRGGAGDDFIDGRSGNDRAEYNDATGAITVNLMEWSEETVVTAFGGGTWTAGGGNTFTYEFPTAADTIAEYAVMFDVEDGDTHHAFMFSRATISGDVTPQWVRGQAALLPVTFALLADETTGAVGSIIGVQAAAS